MSQSQPLFGDGTERDDSVSESNYEKDSLLVQMQEEMHPRFVDSTSSEADDFHTPQERTRKKAVLSFSSSSDLENELGDIKQSQLRHHLDEKTLNLLARARDQAHRLEGGTNIAELSPVEDIDSETEENDLWCRFRRFSKHSEAPSLIEFCEEETGEKLRTGRWTSEEISILINNWFRYFREHPNTSQLSFLCSLSKAQPQMIYELRETFEQTDFYAKIGKGLLRTNRSIISLLRRIFDKKNYHGHFSAEEDDKLSSLVEIHGENLAKLSDTLSRTNDGVHRRIRQLKATAKKTKSILWSIEETLQLRAFIDSLAPDTDPSTLLYQALTGTFTFPGDKAAEVITTRSSSQCNDKWGKSFVSLIFLDRESLVMRANQPRRSNQKWLPLLRIAPHCFNPDLLAYSSKIISRIEQLPQDDRLSFSQIDFKPIIEGLRQENDIQTSVRRIKQLVEFLCQQLVEENLSFTEQIDALAARLSSLCEDASFRVGKNTKKSRTKKCGDVVMWSFVTTSSPPKSSKSSIDSRSKLTADSISLPVENTAVEPAPTAKRRRLLPRDRLFNEDPVPPAGSTMVIPDPAEELPDPIVSGEILRKDKKLKKRKKSLKHCNNLSSPEPSKESDLINIIHKDKKLKKKKKSKKLSKSLSSPDSDCFESHHKEKNRKKKSKKHHHL